MYIVDTNVVSELRKMPTGKLNKSVQAWASTVRAEDLFLSAITILELEMGILLMERRDLSQGAVLRSWLNNHLLPAFSGRILGVDTVVAQQCAKLHVPDPCSERDALIAATAITHAMTIVTRNVVDFVRTGAKVFNPWEEYLGNVPSQTSAYLHNPQSKKYGDQ